MQAPQSLAPLPTQRAAISRHAIRQAKKLLAVTLDQRSESIALARERALHGDGIAFSGRVLKCFAVLGASSAFAHPNKFDRKRALR